MMSRHLTREMVAEDALVRAAISKGDRMLAAAGFTEHGLRHCTLVAERARKILHDLSYPQRTQELAAIAGFLHDIGNSIARHRHEQIGALMAEQILERLGMDIEERLEIAAAIGNHDEQWGEPVTDLAAVIILADKSDVHRARVRDANNLHSDVHDRVNYAVTESSVNVDAETRVISIDLSVDGQVSSVMEYFEIFMPRMKVSRIAAARLDCRLRLTENGNVLL